MQRTDTSGWPCTIARAASVLGDHWNLLLIRQFRPSAGDWLLEIPAGTLEKRETPLACAKRGFPVIAEARIQGW